VHNDHSTQMHTEMTSDTLQRTIRLPNSPCLSCGSEAFTAIVLHASGDPLMVRFCPTCDHRDVREARTGEIRAALDALDGVGL